MTPKEKILNEVISLQAFHAEGLQRSTALRNLLEGEGLTPSSKSRVSKKQVSSAVVNRRNQGLRKKAMH